MRRTKRFPYQRGRNSLGEEGVAPFIPIKMVGPAKTISARALLDTGASLSVIPHSIGLDLGFIWSDQPDIGRLTGNLGGKGAVAVKVKCVIEPFRPVNLYFGWSESDAMPIILGQTNFFMQFDVCFLWSKNRMELRRDEPD